MDNPRSTVAATAMVVGGIIAGAAFVPFTIAHGPTSYNLEREVLGWDMHDWGFLMGTIPRYWSEPGFGGSAHSSPADVAPSSVPSASCAWRCSSSPP